jgi:hypothetical protein
MSIVCRVEIEPMVREDVAAVWGMLQASFRLEYEPDIKYRLWKLFPYSLNGFEANYDDLVTDEGDQEEMERKCWSLKPDKVDLLLFDLKTFRDFIDKEFTFYISWVDKEPKGLKEMTFAEFEKVLRSLEVETGVKYLVR